VEHWDGTSWTIASSPNVDVGNNNLLGVSCVTAQSCVAVGYFADARTLVETWDGTAWTIVPSPSPGTIDNFLNGVSCPIPGECVAVGNVTNAPGNTQQDLVLSNMATPKV
jgi:hypothetical protein